MASNGTVTTSPEHGTHGHALCLTWRPVVTGGGTPRNRICHGHKGSKSVHRHSQQGTLSPVFPFRNGSVKTDGVTCSAEMPGGGTPGGVPAAWWIACWEAVSP
ncbi:MAG: hypothetical protein EBT47_02840 [Chloroflexi bacterium]|nr:hypothetical protein [Chloroflexota bacterium]